MLLAAIETFYDKELDREFYYRPGTEDTTTIQEVFTFGYHIPPEWPFEPGLLVDAGANIGLTMASYRHLWPKAEIIGLELDAENVAIARMNVDDPVLCAALETWNGICRYDGLLATNSYMTQPVDTLEGNRVSIALSLDALTQKKIDFLKLDIEGAERRIVWIGLPNVQSLLVETHFDYTAIDAAKDLQNQGFKTTFHPTHDRAVFAWRET